MEIFEEISKEKDLFIKVSDILFPKTKKEKILLYDIDTTAFEPANGCVFLIGMIYFTDNDLKVKQLFADNINEELPLIKEFLDFTGNYDVVLNYKGDSFDLPFIKGRLDKYRNSLNADEINGIYKKLNNLYQISEDMFGYIRPLKKEMELDSSRLDRLRRITGQRISEKISGENISRFYIIYSANKKLKALREAICSSCRSEYIGEYNPKPVPDDLAHIKTGNEETFMSDLLQRNCENIEAVLYLCRLAYLFKLISNDFETETKDEGDLISIIFNFGSKTYRFSLIKETKKLKQYYVNYRDYYYFPLEDMAMHKSVAEFTDSSSKKKATADTAYSYVSGSFVKIPSRYIRSGKCRSLTRYMDDIRSDEYYMPSDELIRLTGNDLKELASFYFLSEIKDDLNSILI